VVVVGLAALVVVVVVGGVLLPPPLPDPALVPLLTASEAEPEPLQLSTEMVW